MASQLLEIPLFPLHVVLFPGMPLPLHIFEPRYRRMTSDCLDSNLPIGITLALPGSADGHEIPARVGAFARIIDYERLADGRYNLLTVGTQRFRIVELWRDKRLYLTGCVEPLEDAPESDAREQERLAAAGHAALEEYLRTVLKLLESEEHTISLPEDPTELSFLIPSCLSCDDDQKQRLLELTSVSARLIAGIRGLREEIAALDSQGEASEGSEGKGDDPQPPLDSDRARLN